MLDTRPHSIDNEVDASRVSNATTLVLDTAPEGRYSPSAIANTIASVSV